MSSAVIQVDNLSKQYRLGQISGKRLIDDVHRWWALVRGKPDPFIRVGPRLIGAKKFRPHEAMNHNSSGRSAADSLWVLRNVSFEVKAGEVLGIIGRNGAGKSTLLKILSQVTAPTKGEVRVKGRIASLLEVGTGFHPELTGRENVFLNGAILGMTKVEIRKKFDEIVAFSEVEQFIDTPVKRYSSGMSVRLAFAVAAHLEPEILIVDEVLAVGDAAFQKKCLGKMGDVSHQGRTILFVSHNMQAVRTLCTKAAVLHEGQLEYIGSVDSGVDLYESRTAGDTLSTWTRPAEMPTRELAFQNVACSLTGRQPEMTLRLELELQSKGDHEPCYLAVDILDSGGSAIMQAIPTLDGFLCSSKAIHSTTIEIKLPPLIPGRYLVTLWAGYSHLFAIDKISSVVAFDVNISPTPKRAFPHTRDHGFIVPQSSIELDGQKLSSR